MKKNYLILSIFTFGIMLFISFAFLSNAILNPGISYEYENFYEETTIPAYNYYYYGTYMDDDTASIEFYSSDAYHGINVYVLNLENFQKYTNGQSFNYISAWTDIVGMSGGFGVDSADYFYIVFENDNSVSIQIEIDINVLHSTPKPFNPLNLIFPAIIWIITGISIIVLVYTTIKSKEKMVIAVEPKRQPSVSLRTQKVYCSSCGAEILDVTGGFCSKCGTPLK